MTKLDKSEVCDEEARNGFSWGGCSGLLSVAVINVMPKNNSEGERVYFSLQVECQLTVDHH